MKISVRKTTFKFSRFLFLLLVAGAAIAAVSSVDFLSTRTLGLIGLCGALGLFLWVVGGSKR
jgi:hypothetical protein